MSKIAVLDQITIDKIAAGEVVERPASVVKELVENAIDAGASSITVEIKEGGISFIRITDNGSGISKDQVQTAFLRHATSKIQQVEDLQSIGSLGFRGEALSSISAVSQVELITKKPDAFMGVRYEIHGGIEKSFEEIGAPNGTTFLIRNLFFNTPARSKFLKKPATEAGYISSYIEQLAISHPTISFKYLVNNQNKLHTAGNGNLKDVIYSIYGREITKELLPITYQDEQISIEGFIGKPTICRGNRNYENYYVNGRYVKSKIITRAIEDAYKTFMMQHKYPFTAFSIKVKPDTLDVNVHPTKMEVRFSDGFFIYDAVHQCIVNALTGRSLIPEVSISNTKSTLNAKQLSDSKNRLHDKEKKVYVPEPFEVVRKALQTEKEVTQADSTTPMLPKEPEISKALKHEFREYTQIKAYEGKPITTTTLKSTLPNIKSSPVTEVLPPFATVKQETSPKKDDILTATSSIEEPTPTKQPLPDEQIDHLSEKTIYGEQRVLFDGTLLSKDAKIQHKIIGQVFDTYWLVEVSEKLFIIDQHAAHEKVLYERLVKDFRNKEVLSQMISPPMIVTLSLQEIETLNKHKEVFEKFGFEIDSFGGKEYAINALPSHLIGLTKNNLFLDILDQLSEETKNRSIDIISEKLASMACKAAVKGNHTMSLKELEALIEELLTLDNPYNCPHGRPTIISMTKYELEKKFKRIL